MTFCLFTCMLYNILYKYSLPKKKLMYKIIYITFHSVIDANALIQSVTVHLLTHSLTHSITRSFARSHKYSLEIAHVRFTIFALSAGSQPAHNQYWKSREPDPLTLKGQGRLVPCFSNTDYVQTGNQQTIQKWSIG